MTNEVSADLQADPDSTGQEANARQVARDLLAIDAVRFSPSEPFTWSSGLRAPIYCDNRLTLGHPPVRRRITAGFASLIEGELRPELIAGTATAGIPYAAWLAETLDLSMAYVRSGAKEHGRGRRIEGPVTPGQRAVLVEDLISTGGSAASAAQALQEAGSEVQAVLAIFSYGLEAATERFASASFPLYTLTDFPTLLDVAAETGALDETARQILQQWQADPEAWSKEHQS